MRLIIHDFQPIDDPSDRDIADGLASLSGIEDGFAILEASEGFFIQCSGNPEAGFCLECSAEDDAEPRWAAGRPISLSRMTELFQRYAAADPVWDEGIRWAPPDYFGIGEPARPSPVKREKLVEKSSGAIIIGRSWLYNGLALMLLGLGLWIFFTPGTGWRGVAACFVGALVLNALGRRSGGEKRGYRF